MVNKNSVGPNKNQNGNPNPTIWDKSILKNWFKSGIIKPNRQKKFESKKEARNKLLNLLFLPDLMVNTAKISNKMAAIVPIKVVNVTGSRSFYSFFSNLRNLS